MLRIPTTSPILRTLARRSYSTAPTAPFLYSPLSSTRSLLSIQGKDSTKLLQGLVSNDVRKLKQPQDSREGDSILYAALLQADGRYMSDLFLHRNPTPLDPTVPSYLVDHPSTQTSQIRSYLKRHLLRSKVKMGKEAESEWQVVQVWRNLNEGVEKSRWEQGEEWLDGQEGIGRDPRVAGMGWRFVTKKGEELPSELFQQVTPSHYHLHRLSYSVPENPTDFLVGLPMESNLDLMNGVDYKKGCYVGQELTARTHFKGIVRKRGVGIRLFREGEDVPDSFLPTSTPSDQSRLIPSPNLYPTPPPGSILTPLSPSPSATPPPITSTRKPRAPRPAGKLGSTLPLISPSGSTSTIGFGSLKIDSLDQIFSVTPPPPPPPPTAKEGGVGEAFEEREEGEGEDGKWLAKGFMNEWVEFRLEEEEISKGGR
ncbi:hypothetical protein JCM16303_003869 [Sporobolomyces ruberrimus]